MAHELVGKRIAFVIANEGVERAELTEPWKAVEEAGGHPELISPKSGEAQAFNHLDNADTFRVDAVVLPGGVANPDQLRQDEAAVRFVRTFAA
jgi:protease I